MEPAKERMPKLPTRPERTFFSLTFSLFLIHKLTDSRKLLARTISQKQTSYENNFMEHFEKKKNQYMHSMKPIGWQSESQY